jgi:hypothetical protein
VVGLAVLLGLAFGQHDPVRIQGAPATLVTPSGAVAVAPYAVACRPSDTSCHLPEVVPEPRWYRPSHLLVVGRGGVIRIATRARTLTKALWVEIARCGYFRATAASSRSLRLPLAGVRPGLYIARFAFTYRRDGLLVWQTGHFGLQVSSAGQHGTLPMDRCRETP